MGALFATGLAFSAVLPVLPAILTRSGLSPAAVTWHTGMLTGVYMLTVFLFAPWWGQLSDKIGRRPVIVCGLAGMALALLSFAVFRALAPAYAARAFTGIFVAAVIPAATAEAGDIGARRTRPARFALLTSASLFGFLVGPALSGWLADPQWIVFTLPRAASVYIPVLVAAVFSALIAVTAIVWLPRRRFTAPGSASPGNVDRSSLVQRFAPALLVLFVMFALASFEVAITLRGQQRLGWTQAQIGGLFAECSAVMIIIQGVLFAAIIKYVPNVWLVSSGLGAMIVGLVFMPLTQNYDQILLLVVLTSAGASVVAPMITYWASIGAGLAQGAALGTQTAASSFGQALGSAAVAATFPLSDAAPFWIAAGLLVAGAVLLAKGGFQLSRACVTARVPRRADIPD